MDLKRRIAECMEQKKENTQKKKTENTQSSVEVELDGFCMMLKAQLRELPTISRLQNEQQMLKIVTESLIKDQQKQQ